MPNAKQMFRKLLIPALFLLLPMGMLYPLWTCPTSAGEDDVVYYWPLRVIVAEQVRSGQLPLWSDAEAGGVALFADPQSGTFFPPNWMFGFLPSRLAYSLCIFLAFAMAGGGAYLYFRRIGLALSAAVFGAVVFEFCGFMVGHRVHLGLIQTAAFLPWGLWAIENLRNNAHRLKTCATMAPIFALTLAAGHWPTAINLVVVWFVYLLVRGRPIGRALASAAASAVIGSAVLAPQIIATASYIQQTVRSGVPYVVAGENSFFPLAGVLAFFPFIMGNRTPNFFGQTWWGPWHQCEMLGYVGLVTLTLAFGTIWKLYKKKKISTDSIPWVSDDIRKFVRLWTWILIGAGVWALGYYLPTYWLIHMIPIFGSVRCPARMLLVIDLGLATLAAIGIDALIKAPSADFGRTLRRSAARFLPVCMFGSLAVLALVMTCDGRLFNVGQFLTIPPGAEAFDIIAAALNPLSAAVYIPLAVAAVTIVVVWWFVRSTSLTTGRSPRKRVWALTALVVIDLFFIARFVDVPAGGQPCPDPQRSPAAEWLKEKAPDEPFRVWGLSRSYHHRPAELLLPKTCAAMGFETISYYGPFQPAEHPLLFGFRSWGENYEWAWLIRRNHLVSLYNVRYILAADPEFRRVIESVRIPAGPTPPDGPDLLKENWTESENVEFQAGRVLMFRSTSFYSSAAVAAQDVVLEAGKVYRIALDARAPEGAGNCITAEYLACSDDQAGYSVNPAMLRIDIERLTARWRHFEWAFRTPDSAAVSKGTFRIKTHSDLPIEVRNVSLCRSSWSVPINLSNRLKSGDAVYTDRTPKGLPPVGGKYRVHIYENLLCLPRRPAFEKKFLSDYNEQAIEALRWEAEKFDLIRKNGP